MGKQYAWTGILLLLAAGGLLAAAPQAGAPGIAISRETTDITGPLLPDGTPDYLAAFNAVHGRGVTPENNALVPLLEIFGTRAFIEKGESPEEDDKTRVEFLRLIGATPAPVDAPVFKSFLASAGDLFSGFSTDQARAQWNEGQTSLWTAEKNPELARYVAGQTHFFDVAEEASRRPRFYVPAVSPDGHLVHARSPEFVGISEFARAWEARALLRASSGDFEGALGDAVALRRLGRLFGAAGSNIGVLLGDVYDGLGIQVVGTIAGAGKLTAEQCDRCREAMKLPPMPNLVEGRRRDEWIALDRTVLWAKNGFDFKESAGDLVATALFKSIDSSALDFNRMLAQIRQQFEQERGILDAPTLAECTARADALSAQGKAWQQEFEKNHSTFTHGADETPEAYTRRVADGLLAPSLAPVTDMELRRRATLERGELLPVLLAAAKVRAQDGQWPKSLAELIPGALGTAPVDPFSTDGKSQVGYFVKDGHACVVSAGVDHIIGTGDDQPVGDSSALPKANPGSGLP